MSESAPASEEAPRPPPTGWRAALRRYGPWLVAVAILWWIFERVPFATAWEAALDADLPRFATAVGVAVLYWFAVESRAFAFLFSRFNAPLSWAEARSLRAITYLVTPINWNLGTAAIVLHLNRSKQVPALEGTSSVMFYGAVDGVVMSTLMLAGIGLLPEAGALGEVVPPIAIFMLAQTGFMGLVMADEPRWAWLERVRGARIFHSLRRASLRDVAVLLAVRFAYFGGFVMLFWWGPATFGVELPFGVAMASMPLVMGVAALPITPAGLGTQQAVMLYFYAPFGSEAQIVAFGLAFPVALLAGRVLVGLAYVRDLAEFRRTAREPEPVAQTER